MSKSEDVKTLFRRFGGSASSYQEVVSRDQVTDAEEKWPMLGNIRPSNNQEAPSVRRVSVGFGAASGVRQGVGGLPPAHLSPPPLSPPLTERQMSVAQSQTPPQLQPPAQESHLFSGFLAPKGGRATSGQMAAAASEAVPRVGMFDVFKSGSAPPLPVPETQLSALFGAAVAPPRAATPELPAPTTSLAGAFGRMVAPPSAKPKAPVAAVPRQSGQGGGLKDLFGRLVEPPPPPPAPKKAGKPPKKAVKW